MLAKTALVVLLVAALAYAAIAENKEFKCYQCLACDKVPDGEDKLKTCSTNCFVIASNEKGSTTRGCADQKMNCDDIKKAAQQVAPGIDLDNFKCSTCDTDKCNTGNSATSIASSLGLTAVAILLKVYY